MNKYVRSVIAGVLGASMIAGVATADDVQLYHDKGFWSEQLQAVGDASAEATGVRIVENPYATAEQYKAFIQASIASGDAPQMFTWWTGQTFTELTQTGKIAKLNDVWADMVASGEYAESAADLFTVDGDIYAVPLLLARWVMLYNKPLFAELGIEEPTTWDELMAAAETVKAAGHTPFNATVHEGWRGFIWFQELMLRTDPEAYLGLHDGSVAYDSEPVRRAFEMWVDMYDKGYFTDPRSNEEIEDFAGGSAAMYLMGEWVVGSLAASGLETSDLGAFIVPNVDPEAPSAVIVEGGPVVISAAEKDNPDVMTALKFFSSVEGANAWAEASGNYMGNLKADAPNPIIAKINSDMTAAGTATYNRWWEATPPDLQGEFVAELNRFMLDPTMDTAEDVMARMQALNAEYWADQ